MTVKLSALFYGRDFPADGTYEERAKEHISYRMLEIIDYWGVGSYSGTDREKIHLQNWPIRQTKIG